MSSLPIPRVAAVALMLVVGALAAIASPASATPRATPFPLPDELAVPNDLVTGPDGAVWVTDSSLGRIWRIPANGGQIRSHAVGDMPGGITSAYGSMWVTGFRRQRGPSRADRRQLDPLRAAPWRLPDRRRQGLRRRPVVHRGPR